MKFYSKVFKAQWNYYCTGIFYGRGEWGVTNKHCILIFLFFLTREELTALENAEPQLFWKADQKSIHQVDDGSSSKSFSFGMLCSAHRPFKMFCDPSEMLTLVPVTEVYFTTLFFVTDRVFTAEETTSQLYQAVGNPLVVSTVGGYNGMCDEKRIYGNLLFAYATNFSCFFVSVCLEGTVFAYGQTSSGKTFTMMGSDRNPGVIPMAVEDVFKTIKSVRIVELIRNILQFTTHMHIHF